MKKVVVLIL